MIDGLYYFIYGLMSIALTTAYNGLICLIHWPVECAIGIDSMDYYLSLLMFLVSHLVIGLSNAEVSNK